MPAEETTYRQGMQAQFDNMNERMKEFEQYVRQDLGAVKIQTTATNGRVRWLEKMMYTAIGGLGVLSLIVVPLLLALLQSGKL